MGLISEEQYEALKVKEQRIQEEIERVENTYVGTSSNINELLEEYGINAAFRRKFARRADPPAGAEL